MCVCVCVCVCVCTRARVPLAGGEVGGGGGLFIPSLWFSREEKSVKQPLLRETVNRQLAL